MTSKRWKFLKEPFQTTHEPLQIPHGPLQLPHEGRKTFDEAGKIAHEGHLKAPEALKVTHEAVQVPPEGLRLRHEGLTTAPEGVQICAAYRHADSSRGFQPTENRETCSRRVPTNESKSRDDFNCR